MSKIKLTKNGLRLEEKRLSQLQRYLPTLQLKKAMLQSEIQTARQEIIDCENNYHKARLDISDQALLFSEKLSFDLPSLIQVKKVHTNSENIAGVDLPIFASVDFASLNYPLFTTPAWLDPAIELLKKMVEAKAKWQIAKQRKDALQKELREVSIRVNLFEKNLIPKARVHIRKIKIFLEDQLLAAVGQAKVAKEKIQKKKKYAH